MPLLDYAKNVARETSQTVLIHSFQPLFLRWGVWGKSLLTPIRNSKVGASRFSIHRVGGSSMAQWFEMFFPVVLLFSCLVWFAGKDIYFLKRTFNENQVYSHVLRFTCP